MEYASRDMRAYGAQVVRNDERDERERATDAERAEHVGDGREAGRVVQLERRVLQDAEQCGDADRREEGRDVVAAGEQLELLLVLLLQLRLALRAAELLDARRAELSTRTCSRPAGLHVARELRAARLLNAQTVRVAHL